MSKPSSHALKAAESYLRDTFSDNCGELYIEDLATRIDAAADAILREREASFDRRWRVHIEECIAGRVEPSDATMSRLLDWLCEKLAALRNLQAEWREMATARHEGSVASRAAGQSSDEEYAMAGGEMTVWNDCADDLGDALDKLEGKP